MESFLKKPLLDGNATPLIAIISRADVLYKLKWRWTNNTFFNEYLQMDSDSNTVHLRDKATLPARRLSDVIKRCFVFLLCAVSFIALCMAPLKRITDSERYAKFYFTPTGEDVVVGLLFPR